MERPVALKILVSELGREHQEASLLCRLAEGPADRPGRENVPELFDGFEVHGPNGVHQCLVTEVLGTSMASLAECYAANRLPGDVAWKVCRQVVQAVAYMHRMDVVHGGLFRLALLAVQSAKPVCLRSTSRQYRAR
jgi:serine/threonine-protein kinase SRPK3